MPIENDLWLITVRTVARKFIENNYPDEELLFDTFWQTFLFKVNKALNTGIAGTLTLKKTNRVISEISMTREYALDLMTPVIIGTITETMYEMRTKVFSCDELEEYICKAAAHYGANPTLTACLTRHLPQLCNELLSCNSNATEAIISSSPISRYRIWTAGNNIIADSIDKYKNKKNSFLFRIDLDSPPKELTPMSIKLLIHLVENIGAPTSIAIVIRAVFEDISSDNDKQGDINKINQQLSKLEVFSAKRFRQYIMKSWPQNSLGLSDDFRDKYFLFKRFMPDTD